MNKNEVFTAACVVAGNGMGSGMMAIPYFVAHAGIAGGIAAFILAYIVSVLMHLMIAELLIQTDDTKDITGVFNRYFFPGKGGKVLRLLFFLILVTVLIANLAAYISGAVEIITQLVPLSPARIRLVFYVIASLVVILGLKIMCVSEVSAVSIMSVLLVLALVFSFRHINPKFGISVTGSAGACTALFSMIMFSFSAIFAVPQVIDYLDRDTLKIRRSVFMGILINLILSVTVAVCAMITSEEVTKIAIVGWSEAAGGVIKILGSLIIVLAMLTSYWSIGLASSDIISNQTGAGTGLSFSLATLPALVITFIAGSGFMDYLKIVGGAVAVILSFMVIPSYLKCMKNIDNSKIMKDKETKIPVTVFVFLMYIAMAVGSVISV